MCSEIASFWSAHTEVELSCIRDTFFIEADCTDISLYSAILQVRDEEGRRRFHGAFTGGFSAGYYNTVGTKEGMSHFLTGMLTCLPDKPLFSISLAKISGWAPQSFTSSRKNRAEVKQQNILNFLDEDEKAVSSTSYMCACVCAYNN